MFAEVKDFQVELCPRRNFHAEIHLNQPYQLSEEHSLLDLVSRMPSPDREEYEAFRTLKVDVAFVNRIFVVYKPTGLTADKQHRPPQILTQIKVLDFRAASSLGAEIDIEDMTTHQTMTLGYVPQRVFGYDLFASVAPRQRLQWEGTLVQGTVRRSLSFMLMSKVRSRADFYSAGVTCIETPGEFRRLYPNVNLTLASS
jgi:hypothetical protein